MRTAIRSALVVLLLAGFLASQDSTSKPSPDDGEVRNNVYKNSFFGLTYEFPKDWVPHDDATKKRIQELGRNKMDPKGNDPNLDVSEKHTFNLLTVFDHPLGTPGITSYRGIILMAEDVSFAPGIKNGKDFVLNMAQLLKQNNYSPLGEPTERTIADAKFYRQTFKGTVAEGREVYEATEFTIAKGYALGFIYVAGSPEALDEVIKNMGKVEFSKAAAH